MSSLDAQRLLNLAIIDYMCKIGFHQIHEAFSPEIHANPNPFAINFPHEPFLQAWWAKFFEAYNSRFPDDPVFTAETFDKVSQTVENVVANNDPVNQNYASDHAGANISHVMPMIPSPHLVASSHVIESNGSDHTDTRISNLFSSFDTGYELLDFSLEMNEMGSMLPFASNSVYQMPQMPTVPPEWNARTFGDTNQTTQADLPTDQQIIGPIGVIIESSGKQPAVQEQINQVRLQSSDKMFDDTNQTTPANLPTDQQIIGPIGVIIGSSRKQPAVDEQINQMFGDTNQTTPANLPTDQQIIGPIGIIIGSFGKQPAVQEQINQMFGDTNQTTPANLPTDQQIIGPIGVIIESSGKQPAVEEQINQMFGDTNQTTPANLPTDQQIIGPIGVIIESSGKQPAVEEQINQMFGDTNQTTPANLPTDQQIIGPIGIIIGSFGKQPAVQEQINQMFGHTNQTTPANLPTDQQIIGPIGVIIESSGKQPAVEEQINQSDRKRKAPSSSRASVEKGKAPVAASAVPAHTQAERKGIAFEEIRNLHTTKSELLCCHFNSEGELLATAGHDKKVLIWNLGNNNVVNSGEGHVHHITDVRFRPNSTVFATSSLDGTVKMWDAAKPSKPFGNLAGHAGHVMSIDFHPTNLRLLSSCDSNNEIRLWDIRTGDCIFNFKGGSSQVRYQPRLGNVFASSTGNIVNIFDVETNIILKRLQGHIEDVRSICWDRTGNCLASVSEDSARIWYVRDGECIHELNSGDNRFQSCTFHPGHSQVLVIGSDKFLDLWNPIFQRNITWPYSAHDGIVSSLANSFSKGTIASVSHDEQIKIWR
ncbi:hypothetical protein K7X08_033594 [Anisodus acutangulus]|uniref:Uncharacterized protein n=1 Tax=Anisodus acutangulus TaxID=402998 RepID=A0A9Q1RDD6_9SOLA|nr:hypothetical protein K7X08_033594 [Anisodus acutangulus]